MSSITKEVKCNTCGSYMHDTQRCDVWHNNVLCRTDNIYKKECSCDNCRNKCQYCNEISRENNVCYYGHNGNRCSECNEYLIDDKCCFDHTEPFCKFCNQPIYKIDGTCVNYHRENDPICFECKMPKRPNFRHEHDGVKCKICNSLLDDGVCIYKCVDGGNFCIHCNHEGVVNNHCSECGQNSDGQFTKRAMK